MGEFPIYINDVQRPGDIQKLFNKFGEKRAMKIVKGKDNIGKYSLRFILIIGGNPVVLITGVTQQRHISHQIKS